MSDLNGKIALVTGASRGLGYAVAKAMAAEGAHVIALARTQGALEELDDEIQAAGGAATLTPMDLKVSDTASPRFLRVTALPMVFARSVRRLCGSAPV